MLVISFLKVKLDGQGMNEKYDDIFSPTLATLPVCSQVKGVLVAALTFVRVSSLKKQVRFISTFFVNVFFVDDDLLKKI